ncbi:hypothetical protein BKA61DRAFT_681471 [Leptodontidium sp. MPI-SDFR-AT-0119]|nr:hypothetical protein BKA61DRAFT_681471 [Leptodontidium sp. MPI-SDFR-AT-0119]
MHLSNVPTTENTDPSNLMLIWKDITYALISSRHGAVLHHELNTASRTGNVPNNQESCDVVARSGRLQSSANSAENNRWTNEFDGGEESTVPSLDESDSDEDIYDGLTIPSYIIDDAADLSKCHAHPLQDFEEIFAQEEMHMQWKEQSGTDAIPAQVGSMSMPNTPFDHANEAPSTTRTPTPDSGDSEWQDTTNNEVAEKPNTPQVAGQDGLEENITLPLQRAPASRSKRPIKAAGLRDSISYFRDNCRLIYEGWMSFSAEPLADNNNFEQSLVAAMDIVQGLMKGSRIRRLLLRFAYIHLARTILDCKTVAATDRIQGNTYRSVGRRDATVAIDMYLKAKQDVSGEPLKRSTLLGYYRAGRRWADLAGSSPLLVFVLPQVAETIVQNNSITDSTVKNIAYHIQSHHPELTEALVSVSQCAGLVPSNTVPVALMKDVVLRTTQELSTILDRMSEDA